MRRYCWSGKCAKVLRLQTTSTVPVQSIATTDPASEAKIAENSNREIEDMASTTTMLIP